MTKEEAKKFGLQLLHGILERNESYPVYANNVKQAIDVLSETSGSSEIPKDLEEASEKYGHNKHPMTPTGAEESQEDFIAGAKWQKEQDEKELSEKITAAYQLGLTDKEKKMMKEAMKMYPCYDEEHNLVGFSTNYEAKGAYGQLVRIIIVKEEKNGTE